MPLSTEMGQWQNAPAKAEYRLRSLALPVVQRAVPSLPCTELAVPFAWLIECEELGTPQAQVQMKLKAAAPHCPRFWWGSQPHLLRWWKSRCYIDGLACLLGSTSRSQELPSAFQSDHAQHQTLWDMLDDIDAHVWVRRAPAPGHSTERTRP